MLNRPINEALESIRIKRSAITVPQAFGRSAPLGPHRFHRQPGDSLVPRRFLNPPSLFQSVRGWGFSQGVEITGAGRLIFLSGQTPWDASEKPVGLTRREQFRACVNNIRLALESAGGSLDDVVSLRIYMVNYDSREDSDIADALKELFPGPNPPATTWIGITRLAQKEYLVEIEATAFVEN
jgi:2-iminobutanoate/2-iminopropanoate deaminase